MKNSIKDLIIDSAHCSWHHILIKAVDSIPLDYQQFLVEDTKWLPGTAKMFNSFSVPFIEVKFILFGESPYPRTLSANGYAFWDGAVSSLWGKNGFSTEVNRATSLRNFLKMLLVAENILSPHSTQSHAIMNIDSVSLIQTIDELFTNILHCGFLLLNAALTLTSLGKEKDNVAFMKFQQIILKSLLENQKCVKLILFGKLAERILKFPEANHFEKLIAEHPYNLSFINNHNVIDFFKPFHLLLPEKSL